MNRTQALRLAIRSLEYMRARYHAQVDGVYGPESSQSKAALKQRYEITQAITILQKELEAQTHYEVKL